jgi:hypothetical protein
MGFREQLRPERLVPPLELVSIQRKESAMRRSVVPRACLVAGMAIAALICGCSVIGGHMLARSATEDLTASDWVVSVAEAERAVLEVYGKLRIEVVETSRGEQTVVEGRDPNDVGIRTTIKPLRNGVVRISCLAGSFFGTMIPEAETSNLALGVSQSIARKLQGHELGGV